MFKRALRRLAPIHAAALCLSAVALSCSSAAPQAARLALRDPLGILDDVTSDLRLLVLPADGHTCSATGRVEPNLPSAVGGVFPEAVVDITFRVADGTSVDLDPGRYTVLVRGRGTDPVSGVGPNELIATGCQGDVMVAAGETRDVSIEMKQIINPGICGDGVLSPDEQCEGTTPGPCMMCKTSPYAVNTTALNSDSRAAPPALGFSAGGLLVASYDSFINADGTGSQKVRMMVLDDRAQLISSPTALALDEVVGVGGVATGIQTQSAAASSPARLAVAYAGHFVGTDPGGDALVRFFDTSRTPLGVPAAATAASAGSQGAPRIAMTADGTALVAFANDQSPTGASVRLFAAGAVTPAGADATPLGTGLTGVAAPSVAASAGGFVVAFAAAGEVYAQRFGTDGSAVDASPILVTEGVDGSGTQSTARAAALPDGRFSVAFLDEGTGKVRARTFDTSGVPGGVAIDLSGTGASAPSYAGGRERFCAAWIEGGAVHARLLDGAGAPALNRESTPSGDAFVVAPSGASPIVSTGGPASQGILAVGFVSGTTLDARLYAIP